MHIDIASTSLSIVSAFSRRHSLLARIAYRNTYTGEYCKKLRFELPPISQLQNIIHLNDELDPRYTARNRPVFQECGDISPEHSGEK